MDLPRRVKIQNKKQSIISSGLKTTPGPWLFDNKDDNVIKLFPPPHPPPPFPPPPLPPLSPPPSPPRLPAAIRSGDFYMFEDDSEEEGEEEEVGGATEEADDLDDDKNKKLGPLQVRKERTGL